MNEIIVIGGNHENTLGVLRSLGRYGLKSNLILTYREKNSPFISKSKYIKSIVIVNDSKQALDILFEKFGNLIEKPVIIACHDLIASLIDENKEILKTKFYIPCIEGSESLHLWMNKNKMNNLALDLGLRIPKVWEINDLSDKSLIEYPCIVKPLLSEYGGKDNFKICYSLNELNAYLLTHDINKIQIQQYIDKQYEFQIIGCSLNAGNIVVIPGISNVLRTSSCSNTGFISFCKINNDNQAIVLKCKEYVKRIGYSGLFSIEFIKDKLGNDYFLEMNFRNDGNTISVYDAGLNLPYIWYLGCIGKDISSEISKKVKEVNVISELNEISWTRHGIIKLKDCIKDFYKCDYMKIYASDDIKPFFYLLKNIILRKFFK